MSNAPATDSVVLARQTAERLAAALAEQVSRAAAKHAIASAALSPAYRAFQRKYRHRPDLFVIDCFIWATGAGPTPYQLAALLDLVAHRRICIRGPHGLGKTTLLAWIILWFSLTREGEDWKAPTTASVWRQLQEFLWPEVRKWAKRLRWDLIGREPWVEGRELLGHSIRLQGGSAFAAASDKESNLEGAHADQLLYILDECKTISDATFDAVEGAFSAAGGASEAYGVAASTPGDPAGRFYDIQSHKAGYEDWHVIAVRMEQVLLAGRMSPTWQAQREREWGAESAVYLNRVKGEFSTGKADGVIPLSWVEAANERWYAWKAAGAVLPPLRAVGADVGGGGEGGDASTICRLHGTVVPSIEKYSGLNELALAGRIYGILLAHGGYAVIDVIGIGAGTVHRTKELGGTAYGFNASGKTTLTDRSGEIHFINMRALGWWNLREMLDPESGVGMALPPNDELTGDLTAPTYRDQSNGRRIEEKSEVRKRLHRSTDVGDSLMEACCPLQALRNPAEDVRDFYRKQFESLQADKVAADKVAA